jgi:hypothetical protein
MMKQAKQMENEHFGDKIVKSFCMNGASIALLGVLFHDVVDSCIDRQLHGSKNECALSNTNGTCP